MATKKDIMNLESMFMLAEIERSSGKRQASKQYNVSVDTLNKYLDNLESELGFKLLSSSGRGSVLTPRAEELMAKISQIEAVLHEIYSLKSDRKDISGEVVIGMPLIVSSNLQPLDMPSFFDRYPGIRFKSQISLDSETTEARISNVDIAIVAVKPTNPDLVIVASKEIECGLFASPEYLSRYGYPLDIEDMLKNHRIVHKIGMETWIPEWNNMVKKTHCISYISSSPYTQIEAVRNSGGISVLPLRYKEEGLVCLDNIKLETTLTFYLVAHKQSKDIPKIRAVLDYYKELILAL